MVTDKYCGTMRHTMLNPGDNFEALDRAAFGQPASVKILDDIVECTVESLSAVEFTANKECAQIIRDSLNPDEIVGYLLFQAEYNSGQTDEPRTAVAILDDEFSHELMYLECEPEGTLSSVRVEVAYIDEALAALDRLEHTISESSKMHGLIRTLRLALTEADFDAELKSALNQEMLRSGVSQHIATTLRKSDSPLTIDKSEVIHSSEREELIVSSKDIIFKDSPDPAILQEQKEAAATLPHLTIEYDDLVNGVFYTFMELGDGSRHLQIKDFTDHDEEPNDDAIAFYDGLMQSNYFKPRMEPSKLILAKLREFTGTSPAAENWLDEELKALLDEG